LPQKKSKSLWKIIEKESGRMNDTEQMASIFNSNSTIIHIDEAADVFNKCFLTLIVRLKLDCTDIGSAVLFLKRSFTVSFPNNGNNTNHRSRISEHNFFIEFQKFSWI
jgi:hypothetical protein